MENVFDRILRSKPNSFVVFGSGGPFQAGVSPMPHAATGLTYSVSHLLPRKLSGCARGAGSISFDGRFCPNPLEGGGGSIEMIRMRGTFDNEILVNIPNFLELRRSVSGQDMDRYELTVMSEQVLSVELGVAPRIEHVVVNIDGQAVTLVVNGTTYSGMVSEQATFLGSSNIQVFPASGSLWGVAIRPVSLSEEYCKEVTDMMYSFPTPAEADAQYNATTFVYDVSLIQSQTVFRLEDLSYPNAPESSLMFNGSLMSDIEVSFTEGWLNIPDTELMKYVLIENDVVAPVIVGSEFAESPVEEEGGSEIEDISDFSVSETNYNGDVVEINSLNQEIIGSPERVLVVHPLELGYDSAPRSMHLRFCPETLNIPSTSMPDRLLTLNPVGRFIGHAKQFAGGFQGQSTILPDANATLSSEYPVAYGMWVFIDATAEEVLVTNGDFTLSVAADGKLVKSNIGSVYLNGTLYSSQTVAKGWHHVSFIPVTASNLPINLGTLNTNNIVYSFSLFYNPSPEGYLASVYGSYVNPPSIKPTSPESMSITEVGVDIYSHDWSISSAD